MQVSTLGLQLGLLTISFLANFLSAFSGGGAGLIQLPALIFLGLPFSSALATHKLASVALGAGASFRHLKEGTLKPGFAFFILCSGLPGVYLGSSTVLLIPDDLATAALGIITLFVGIYSSYRPKLGTNDSYVSMNLVRLLIGSFGLFIIGFLNGSLTSGTGLFVTLWLVSWFGFSYTRAIAYTLILVGLFWNGTGALVLGFSGKVYWTWVPTLIVGSLVGGYFGSHYSIKKGNFLVKRCFELLSITIGISLITKSLV